MLRSFGFYFLLVLFLIAVDDPLRKDSGPSGRRSTGGGIGDAVWKPLDRASVETLVRNKV
jgi:hypothetical protein